MQVTVTTAEGIRETNSASTDIRSAAPLPPSPQRPSTAAAASGPVTGTLQLSVNESSEFRVGQEATYTIELKNDRAVSDSNISVTVRLPEGLQFVRFVSDSNLAIASRVDDVYEVDTIREIRPGGVRTFRLIVSARQGGPQELGVEATSFRSPNPVTALRETQVRP